MVWRVEEDATVARSATGHAPMTPLRLRILGALRLQPMTMAELECCLMRSRDAIRINMYRLRDQAMVEVCGHERARKGQSRDVYRLRWTHSLLQRKTQSTDREQ